MAFMHTAAWPSCTEAGSTASGMARMVDTSPMSACAVLNQVALVAGNSRPYSRLTTA